MANSEEEAKKKIYNVSCERYFGFGCEINEETANQLESKCTYHVALLNSSGGIIAINLHC